MRSQIIGRHALYFIRFLGVAVMSTASSTTFAQGGEADEVVVLREHSTALWTSVVLEARDFEGEPIRISLRLAPEGEIIDEAKAWIGDTEISLISDALQSKLIPYFGNVVLQERESQGRRYYVLLFRYSYPSVCPMRECMHVMIEFTKDGLQTTSILFE